MRLHLPTRNTVNKVSVDIYRPEVFAKLKAGLLVKEEAQKLVVIQRWCLAFVPALFRGFQCQSEHSGGASRGCVDERRVGCIWNLA
jgi:hypothetical protein